MTRESFEFYYQLYGEMVTTNTEVPTFGDFMHYAAVSTEFVEIGALKNKLLIVEDMEALPSAMFAAVGDRGVFMTREARAPLPNIMQIELRALECFEDMNIEGKPTCPPKEFGMNKRRRKYK
jgi:hypothetical protein